MKTQVTQGNSNVSAVAIRIPHYTLYSVTYFPFSSSHFHIRRTIPLLRSFLSLSRSIIHRHTQTHSLSLNAKFECREQQLCMCNSAVSDAPLSVDRPFTAGEVLAISFLLSSRFFHSLTAVAIVDGTLFQSNSEVEKSTVAETS